MCFYVFAGLYFMENQNLEIQQSESSKIFIKAFDEEGCDMISALLQDSIMHVSYHSFHEDKNCLRIMLNRFCWELLNDNISAEYYRVHSGLYIHNVKDIIVNDNFKKVSDERYLNLLALHASKAENEINLLFSGHKTMCVKVDELSVYLKDLHEKYPTPTRPFHDVLNAE